MLNIRLRSVAGCIGVGIGFTYVAALNCVEKPNMEFRLQSAVMVKSSDPTSLS